MHFNSDAEKDDDGDADNDDGNSGDEQTPMNNVNLSQMDDEADLNEITMNAIESAFPFYFE